MSDHAMWASEAFSVNPQIAEVLDQAGYIERLGTGLEYLFLACRKAGFPKPKSDMLNGEFHITGFRKNHGKAFQRRQESMTQVARVLAIWAGGPESMLVIARSLGQKKISRQVNWGLAELLHSSKSGWTMPEKPNSRFQKFVLLEA